MRGCTVMSSKFVTQQKVRHGFSETFCASGEVIFEFSHFHQKKVPFKDVQQPDTGYQLSRIPDMQPDIRQSKSSIRPDTGYKKNGRISGTSLIPLKYF